MAILQGFGRYIPESNQSAIGPMLVRKPTLPLGKSRIGEEPDTQPAGLGARAALLNTGAGRAAERARRYVSAWLIASARASARIADADSPGATARMANNC